MIYQLSEEYIHIHAGGRGFTYMWVHPTMLHVGYGGRVYAECTHVVDMPKCSTCSIIG